MPFFPGTVATATLVRTPQQTEVLYVTIQVPTSVGVVDTSNGLRPTTAQAQDPGNLIGRTVSVEITDGDMLGLTVT